MSVITNESFMLQTLCDIFGYCEAPDELYDRFVNPKIKVRT